MPTIELGGQRIFYREQGTGGPPLLLVHGAGGSSLHYQELLGILGRRRRAVALDLPGHGGSPPFSPRVTPSALITRYREVVAELAERLGLGRVALVGHSMGGAVAQDYAVAYPDRLAALVLLGTGARLKVSREILDTIRQRAGEVPRMMGQLGFSPASSPGRVEAWAAQLLQAPAEVFWADMKACSTFDLRPQVGEVQVPAAVLAAEDDRLTPPALQEQLAGLLGRARLERIPRAGHFMFWERPDRVAALILEGA